MKISILIPTLNHIEFMKLIVRAYREHTSNPHEILVYANAMSPEMKALAAKENYDVFQHSAKNEGIAVAVNSLRREATGDIICITNDDMYVAPNWDVGLAKKLNDDIFYQFLAGTMFERIGKNPLMNAPFDYGDQPENFREKAFLAEWWDKRIIKEDICSGMGVIFMRKELWDSVGGLSEIFYPGLGTDPDLIAKIYYGAKKEGKRWELRGVADSGIYHFQTGTVHGVARKFGGSRRSHRIFRDKWGLEMRDLFILTGQSKKL